MAMMMVIEDADENDEGDDDDDDDDGEFVLSSFTCCVHLETFASTVRFSL